MSTFITTGLFIIKHCSWNNKKNCQWSIIPTGSTCPALPYFDIANIYARIIPFFCTIYSLFYRVFLTDIGNFSFWSDESVGKYMVKYGGKEWTGYWSYVAAINRALDVSQTLPKSTVKSKQLSVIISV